jgi:hypothetical protein
MLVVNQNQSYTPPPVINTVIMPKYQATACPFCDCEKEIRYSMFNTHTGKIEPAVMTSNSFRNTIVYQGLLEHNKPIECYCPQCYVAFSISKCLGIV